MKATGIVRRIDDLGRIVIPKEIRRILHIREGDPLEIYTHTDGSVILKKYSPVGEMGAYTEELAHSMNSALERSVLICDKDSVVAAVGGGCREYLGKPVSSELVEVIERRKRIVRQGEEEKIPIRKAVEREELWGQLIQPILSEGQTLGGIVLCRRYLRHDRSAQALCIVVCALTALACAVYIGLTVLLVAAVQNRPPTL